jgi:hypothetical protein
MVSEGSKMGEQGTSGQRKNITLMMTQALK